MRNIRECIIWPTKVGMPGGVDPVLRFMVKFYMPDPSQLEEEYTRYNLIIICPFYVWPQSTLRKVKYLMIFYQNDHVSDGDDDVHQVPLLTADQEGPGLRATSGKKNPQFWWFFTQALSFKWITYSFTWRIYFSLTSKSWRIGFSLKSKSSRIDFSLFKSKSWRINFSVTRTQRHWWPPT